MALHRVVVEWGRCVFHLQNPLKARKRLVSQLANLMERPRMSFLTTEYSGSFQVCALAGTSKLFLLVP